MDRKKFVLVIAIATIFALITAIYLKNIPNNTSEELIKEESIEEILPQETETPEQTEEQNPSTQLDKPEQADVVKTTPKVIEKTTQEVSSYKKLELKEVYTHQEESNPQAVVDPGIINDNGTIVVTKEFKIKTPSKYTFEGFGSLKNISN